MSRVTPLTARPLHCAPNRGAFKEREYIQQQVQEMLKIKLFNHLKVRGDPG
jgi:hypothetical protein